MGASLTGSSAGSWFHRLGLFEASWLDLASFYGGTTTSNVGSAAQLTTRLASITTDLVAGTADYQISALTQQAVAAAQISGPAGLALQQTVQQLFVNMVQIDTAQKDLTPLSALQLLIGEMVGASATINQGTLPAVGAQTALTGVSPVGNPVFVFSAKDAVGRGLQYVIPETAVATITQDWQNGATAGQEPYSMVTPAANANFFSYDWLSSKYGSGANLTGTLVDPSVSNTATISTAGGGSLTVNGTFTTYSNTDYADNWVYSVGVATTNFANSSASQSYYTTTSGAKVGSIQMISAGGTLNDLRQKFSTTSTTGAGTGGTPYVLLASGVNNTQYAVFVAYKLSNASPTNGTLTIDLCDSTGTTVNDDQGTANSVAVNLTAIADTNWHTQTLVVRLPQTLTTNLPMAIRLRFTGTILDSGKSVYIGAVGVAVMQNLYVGGPAFTGFRGSTFPIASGAYADAWTFSITATIGKLQKAMWRWINPPALAPMTPGLIVPAVTSGSATISDSLVA